MLRIVILLYALLLAHSLQAESVYKAANAPGAIGETGSLLPSMTHHARAETSFLRQA